VTTLATLPDKDSFKATEACRLAEVAPYVLRYWESEFPALSAGKEKGAQRIYTRRDLLIISRIRELLYDEGFTIAGAKKKLDAEIRDGRFEKETGGAKRETKSPVAAAPEPSAPGPRREERAAPPEKKPATIQAAPESSVDRKRLLRELKEIVAMLDGKTRKSGAGRA
jgi:DNA-binding transcriptional MerR regulator